MTVYALSFTSTLGPMLLTRNEQGLAGCYFRDQKHFPAAAAQYLAAPDDPLLGKAKMLLENYFRTAQLHCPLPLAPQGSAFQQQVWQALQQIPAGQTRSYAQVAAMLGRPSASRAVAGAIGRNPIGIIIPCHRVIGSNGSLTGYAGGIDRKAALLKLEGVTTGR